MTTEMLITLLLIGGTLGGVYAIMALGLTLVHGVTRIFNYAQGSFFIWGAYFAWCLFTRFPHLNYGLVFVITIAIMFLFGLLYERALMYPLRRFADWTFTAIIVTLGSALFLDNLALAVFGPKAKTLPPSVEGSFNLGGFVVAKHSIVILVVAVVIVIILILFLGKTKEGMAMRGVAQDAVGARIVGISIDRMYSHSFAITAALGGIAGMLLAPRTMIVPTLGWIVLIKAFVIVIFGGLGSIKGSLIAAFILAMVEVFVTYYIGATWALPSFLIILVILLVFRHRGLFGEW